MRKIKYLDKPAGLTVPGLKGAGPLSSLAVGKRLDDGSVLSSIELDDAGVVYFRRSKDGHPVRLKFKDIEADCSCIHVSHLGAFILDDDEQPAKPAQQQGQQRR